MEYPNEYSQELHFYPFPVKLNTLVGSCTTLNDLFNKLCVLNKIEGLNINVFNMIAGKMKQKFQQKIYHVNSNTNLMEKIKSKVV